MTIKPGHEDWRCFYFFQNLKQTFPMRDKTLPDRKYVFQNPDKKLKIGRTATEDLNKSAA